MTLGTTVYDAAASVLRALPRFPGKWRLAGALHRGLWPLRGAADPLVGVHMRNGTRMRWDLRDLSEARAYWLGEWDDAVRDAVTVRLGADAVVLDVGANVGAWTVPLAKYCHAGRVYAFEPVPANRARLEQALADNQLTNVTVAAIALGEQSSTVELWLRTSLTGASSGTAAITHAGAGHLSVPMEPMDGWAAQAGISRCDFLKLDVEGAELRVLAGAEQFVRRFRPIILAEFDTYWMSQQGVSSDDGANWARAHDYTIYSWSSRHRRWEPATTTSAEAVLLVPA